MAEQEKDCETRKENLRIEVKLAERSYAILLGEHILPACVAGLKDFTPEKEVFVITDQTVNSHYGADLEKLLRREGYEPTFYILKPGESAKTWQNAELILERMLSDNLSRQVPVLALGGGVIGDLAGFVAALYRRGVPLIQIPTTLLAQVDSSVGGKVAVNHPRGKNMLGTFYQPRQVWADLHTLRTLDQRQWRAGLAEVLKYALLWDEKFFIYLEEHAGEILRFGEYERQNAQDKQNERDKENNTAVLTAVIEQCVRIKAEIVSQDERDEGLRNILNLGHTIGHALEKATHFQQYLHGEAVAIGLRAVGKIAVAMGLFGNRAMGRVERLMGAWGLPMNLPADILHEVAEGLKLDKKVVQKETFFILPVSLGKVTVQKGLTEELMMRVLREMGE